MTVEEFLEIHPDEDVDLQVPEGRDRKSVV